MWDEDAIHLVPYQGQWAVQRSGDERPAAVYPNLADALLSARAAARSAGVDLIHHAPSGNVVHREQPARG